jgi:3-phosphoshikimate 1-carboxyvinyltransferase
VTVKAQELPSMIDELPMLFTVAAFAQGTTIVEGAKELKVKESDRIEALRENLARMGAVMRVTEYLDKKGEKDYRVEIDGGAKLKPVSIRAHHDHRVAMSMLVAHTVLGEREVTIDDVKCINKSFPTFVKTLQRMGRKAKGRKSS